MDAWWEHQCQDSSFQEVKSVFPRFPWGSSTWELQLPAARIQRAEDGQASKPVTFYNETVGCRAQRWENKDMMSIISSTQYKELKERLHKEGQGWLNVRRRMARRKKWEVETGQDKSPSFPLLKGSNMTYKGQEKDDETGWGEVIWSHTETKGKQTELMWLPAPICKIFNSPENFHATPTFILSTLPSAPSPLRYTHHVEHFHLWSCLACWIFL